MRLLVRHMTDRLAHFEHIARQQGLSLTVQRRVILQELLAREDHPTADQIYESVRDRVPGMSRTTVYRVLDMLVQLGAARKLFHPDAVVRFDPHVERHHHLVCQQCGRLVDLAASAIRDIPIPDTRDAGFTITDYSVSFTGICTGCQKSSKRERSKSWQKH